MQIRRFQQGDEAALFQVFFSSIHEIASRDYSAEQTAAWAPTDMDPLAWARNIRAIQPFIVELEGEIAGYADVQHDGYIDHFFVSGCYPQRGVGTLLMQTIHQQARQDGISVLTSNVSKTAESFFLRHGFYVVERGFPVRRGVTLHNALMRKDLSA